MTSERLRKEQINRPIRASVNFAIASRTDHLASTGENMREYLIPDTKPNRLNRRVMAPIKGHHNRVSNVLPPDFGKIAMALHERRINHQVMDVRKKTGHLFKLEKR